MIQRGTTRTTVGRLVAASFAGAGALALLAACASPGDAASGLSEGDVLGAWGDTADMSSPSLEFADDGRVSGTDGCNRLMGDWKLDDGTVVFGPLASTMMACEGVETWLGFADTATIEADALVVFDAAGERIGELPRAE